MQRKTTSGSLTLDPKALENTHILPQCIEMVTNNRRLTVARYQKLQEHYEQCIHCQVLVGRFLKTTQREEQDGIDSATPERRHLQRLVHMLHSIVRENIAVYIDLLEEQGMKEASDRFPAFAEHLDSCQECQRSIEETREWLKATQGV